LFVNLFTGKTTTVHLVCKELGFDIVEFNASDTRSKKLLHEEVSELLSNKSLSGYFQGELVCSIITHAALHATLLEVKCCISVLKVLGSRPSRSTMDSSA
jgi:DNA polymerase III delta prime subunit